MENNISVGSEVELKIDIRGFLATYVVKEIVGGNAFIKKTHFWNTDPLNETWQPLSKLKLRK